MFSGVSLADRLKAAVNQLEATGSQLQARAIATANSATESVRASSGATPGASRPGTPSVTVTSTSPPKANAGAGSGSGSDAAATGSGSTYAQSTSHLAESALSGLRKSFNIARSSIDGSRPASVEVTPSGEAKREEKELKVVEKGEVNGDEKEKEEGKEEGKEDEVKEDEEKEEAKETVKAEEEVKVEDEAPNDPSTEAEPTASTKDTAPPQDEPEPEAEADTPATEPATPTTAEPVPEGTVSKSKKKKNKKKKKGKAAADAEAEKDDKEDEAEAAVPEAKEAVAVPEAKEEVKEEVKEEAKEEPKVEAKEEPKESEQPSETKEPLVEPETAPEPTTAEPAKSLPASPATSLPASPTKAADPKTPPKQKQPSEEAKAAMKAAIADTKTHKTPSSPPPLVSPSKEDDPSKRLVDVERRFAGKQLNSCAHAHARPLETVHGAPDANALGQQDCPRAHAAGWHCGRGCARGLDPDGERQGGDDHDRVDAVAEQDDL